MTFCKTNVFISQFHLHISRSTICKLWATDQFWPLHTGLHSSASPITASQGLQRTCKTMPGVPTARVPSPTNVSPGVEPAGADVLR